LIIFFIVSILTIEGIKLKISVHVDGSGGSNSGFGFFVKETGESFYQKKSEITNN
jgi:ribonuclease HI